MKKLTFALACASTFALFAEINAPKADFEGYTGEPDWTVANKFEPGSQDTYWFYDSTSSSADGSTVKAYGGENLAKPTKGDLAGNKYLELSTEGGTLWSSLAAGNTAAEGIANKLGAAQALPAGGLYIDTMVQFTATEDGGAPETAEGDKLAIWLDKTGTEESPVYTLKVKGAFLTAVVSGRGSKPATEVKYKVYALSGVDILPGTWHQLTVTVVKNLFDTTVAKNCFMSGFIVKIDEQVLAIASGDSAGDDNFASIPATWFAQGMKAAFDDRQFIPSMVGFQDDDKSALQAVGFKGSGALDNLQFTTQEPGGEDPAPVKVGLTISAGNATVTGITAGEVEVGSNLTFTVTAAEGYNLTGVTINGNTVTADAGNYTYTVKADDKAVAVVVTTEAIPQIDWEHPDTSAGTTAGDMFKLTGPIAAADGDTVATWAKKYSVNFADASTIKVEAFLLNCANTDDAIIEAKANFKIPSITIDANGTVTVASPDPDGSKYNGVITIKGSVTVNGTYDLVKGTDGKFPEGARFFKAFLSVK